MVSPPIAVIDAYARRILRGEITLDDVPAVCREEVKKRIQNIQNVTD